MFNIFHVNMKELKLKEFFFTLLSDSKKYLIRIPKYTYVSSNLLLPTIPEKKDKVKRSNKNGKDKKTSISVSL